MSTGSDLTKNQETPTPAPGVHQADAHNAVKRIARAGSANLLGAGLSAVANFVLVILITRLWDATTAGTLFALTSLFLIALALSQLGVDQGLIRFLAWNAGRGQSGGNRRMILSGILVALSLALVITALGVVFASQVAQFLVDAASVQAAEMLTVLAWALPVAATYELFLAVTRGLSKMKPTIVIERMVRPVLQVLAVLAVGLIGGNATTLALAWSAPYAVGLCSVAAWLVVHRHALFRSDQAVTATSPRGDIREFWRFTIPRGLARLAQVGLQRSDIILVTIIAGPAIATLYTAVSRFLALGQLATAAIQQVSEPQVAKLLSRNNHDGARLVTRQLTLWSVILATPIYITFVVFADVLLSTFFGESYVAGADSLRILALAMLFAAAMGPMDMLLLMAGRSSLSLINTICALIVDVVACLLLIPIWGATGAAVAWMGAIIVKNVLCYLQVQRTLAISPFSRQGAIAITAIFVIFFILTSLARWVFAENLMTDLLIVSGATLIYASCLWWRRDGLILKS